MDWYEFIDGCMDSALIPKAQEDTPEHEEGLLEHDDTEKDSSVRRRL